MSEWQPIETAPTNGESVLLYYGPKYYIMEGSCFPRAMRYRGDMPYRWVSALDMGDLEPTHWMPLPKPPYRKQGGDV